MESVRIGCRGARTRFDTVRSDLGICDARKTRTLLILIWIVAKQRMCYEPFNGKNTAKYGLSPKARPSKGDTAAMNIPSEDIRHIFPLARKLLLDAFSISIHLSATILKLHVITIKVVFGRDLSSD